MFQNKNHDLKIITMMIFFIIITTRFEIFTKKVHVKLQNIYCSFQSMIAILIQRNFSIVIKVEGLTVAINTNIQMTVFAMVRQCSIRVQ